MREDHRLTVFTLADGTSITTRSALETRWAIFFSEIRLKWKYEPSKLSFKGGWYTPDFGVEGLGFVEIKPTLDLLISESSRKLEKAARNYPTETIFAFCGERVSFDTVAMYQGKSIFAPTYKKMVQILHGIVKPINSQAFECQIAVSMSRANRAKLDHFVNVGKVLELEVIPDLKTTGELT